MLALTAFACLAFAGCGGGDGADDTGDAATTTDESDSQPSGPTAKDVASCLDDAGLKTVDGGGGTYIPDDDAIPEIEFSVIALGKFTGGAVPDSIQIFEGTQADANAAAEEVAARTSANLASLEALGVPGAEIPEGDIAGTLGPAYVFVNETTPEADRSAILVCAAG